MQRRVLGRGLSALMTETANEPQSSEEGIANLDISEIRENEFQPRQDIDPLKLAELLASIKEKGIIQPIIVRPKEEGYELIAGERRWRAAKQLGLTHLPAIIKDVDDAEALQLALIENLQRQDLNPLEEAVAYQRLLNEFNFTQEKIGEVVGKNPSSVSNTLRLLKLPAEIQDALRKGVIAMGHARAILGAKNLQEMLSIFHHIVPQQLSVRQVEQIVISKNSGENRKRGKTFTSKNPQIAALEEQLQRTLGTRVKIFSGRKRGKIVLEYYSPEDLERLLTMLNR